MTRTTEISRIASMLSSATEMLCGLGLQSQLIAISHECDYPPEITHLPRVTKTRIPPTLSSQQIDDEVRQRMEAGEPLYEVDVKLLEALAPDLIVTQAQCDVCAVRLADVEQAVASSARLRQTQIVSLNPASLSDVLLDIERVADACGATQAAHDYGRSLNARVEQVRGVTGPLSANGRRKVALIEWIEPLMLSGNWMPELIEMAGGEHALTEQGKHSPYVPWEEILRYDPEVVVIAPCGFDLNRTLAEVKLLSQRLGWNGLAAVQTGGVYAMDGNAYFNRSGPRLVDSLEILAHLIYPEHVGVPDCVLHPEQVWRKLV